MNTNFEQAEKIVNETIEKYKLTWNFESIDFVLNTERVSFDDLEKCDTNNKSLRLIIQSGLSGHDKSKAFKIMDEIREAGVTPKLAHLYFVETLKVKHFFSDTSEKVDILMKQMELIQKMSSLKDLSGNV